MASIKNSPYNFDTYEQKQFVYSANFGLATNTAKSYKQKMDLINSICFLQQRMSKKDPEKYKNCLALLQIIFGREFQQSGDVPGEDTLLTGLSIICDDLLYVVEDEIPAPEGCKTLKDVKDKIVDYIKNEWLPF
jgi:hypothetical protein